MQVPPMYTVKPEMLLLKGGYSNSASAIDLKNILVYRGDDINVYQQR